MNDKNQLISYKKAVKYQIRSWKILGKLCPGLFVSSILFSVFDASIPLVEVWLSARILNELAGGSDPHTLFQLILIQLITSAALAAGRGGLLRWKNYEEASAYKVKERVYVEKFLSMDYADIDRQYVYDLFSQIRQAENWGGWGLEDSIERVTTFATQLIRIFGGIGLSVSLFILKVPESGGYGWLNHPLCIAVILAILVFVTLASSSCANQANKQLTRLADDMLLGNRYFGFYGQMCLERERAADLRMYEQQERVCDPYLAMSVFFQKHSMMTRIYGGLMGLWKGLSASLSAVLTGAIYLFVCIKAWAGAFGAGSIAQYVGAITSLFIGLSDLLQSLGTMRLNGTYLEYIYELLDIPNNMYQGSLTTEKRSDREYDVEFRDVSFKYPGSDVYALRHVNMKFKVGRRIAVVGMNGSGKTTFIKLLCRLYDPTEGEILLNGIDIRKYRYDDYIRIFSVVFQDFRLFALPLGENVAGAREYDREKVMDCLAKAGFDDRLKTMPKGLSTWLYKDLDKEGVEVSGGEAQKIAIARALYKDAPFIILDEPTAALDPIAEAEIYSKFNDIIEDKTAVYISHRLSSCKFCDEILVFDQGSVIQQGSHDTLVADQSGKYYQLWHAQAQYYDDTRVK